MQTSTVRVLVVDDHPLYRYAIEQVIGRDPTLELTASCRDRASALRHALRGDVDVALVDLGLPDSDDVGIVRAMVERCGVARVVVLSGSLNAGLVRRAITAGAAGYVSKDAEPQEICLAIRAVAAGQTFLSSAVQRAVALEMRGDPRDLVCTLSERERMVLALAAEGLSREAIAKELHVSLSTVKAHLGSIYRKLGVSRTSGAVAAAMRQGLI